MKLIAAHTSALDEATLAAARALLYEVFAEEMTEADWDHCLGGLHALAYEGDELIGHAAVVQRHLLHGGRVLRAGYVEGVVVKESHRRRGHASALMHELEAVIRRAYHLGALGTSEDGKPFYEALGWKQWKGPTSALTPSGVRRTPDEDGWIYVYEAAAPLDLSAELTCDWRDGDAW